METAASRYPSRPVWPTTVAAVLTVAAVVLLDALGGADATHTWWLALVAMALAGLRFCAFGRRHPGLVAALSALVLAQPALHVANETWHHTLERLDTGPAHVAVHGILLALHLVLACAAVLLIALADLVLLAATRTVLRVVRLLVALRPAVPQHAAPRRCTVALGPVGELTVWVEYAVRRGPPQRAAVLV